jgi:hypothetical protein
VLFISIHKLIESRSPLSRRLYNIICALECYHLHEEETVQKHLNITPKSPSIFYTFFFKCAPNTLDFITFVAKESNYIAGILWSFIWSFANGGLAIFHGRPVQMSTINESELWVYRLQMVLHGLYLTLPSFVASMSLVARCVTCADDVDNNSGMRYQWSGGQECYGPNQTFLTFFIVILLPITAVTCFFVSVFPFVIALDIFYSKEIIK